jgi:hypothetical protein
MPRMSWYNPRSWFREEPDGLWRPAEVLKAESPAQIAAGVTPPGAGGEPPMGVPIGTTGLRRFGGWIEEELLVKLAGRRAALVYREMSDNDPVVGAILYVVESLLRQAKWRTEPASESARAKEAADFFETCIDDMDHTWDELIAEVLSMLPFGWAYFETIFKVRRGRSVDPRFRSRYDDGKVGLRRISIRAQDTLDRWEFDEEGQVLGMWQSDPYAGGARLVFIPLARALLFRTTSRKNNPEGRSMLRNAYRPWFFSKRIQEIEAIGIERDLTGLPVIQIPPELLLKNATPDQQQAAAKFKTLVQQIRRDEREGIVIPSEQDREGKPTGYKLSLLTTGGRRAIDTSQVVTRHEQRIAMTMLAEFLFLGTDKVGSYSLASTKTSLFTMALGSLMENIASTFNRHLIPRLMGLNGYTADEYPAVVYGDIEAPPLEEVAAFVNQLVNAGVLTPDKSLERKLREIGNLPQLDDERDLALPGEVAPEATLPPVDAPAADSALNGAQVVAAQGIVRDVALGAIPRESGVAMLQEFFQLTAAQAERIMGSVGRGFVPSEAPAQAQR